MTSAFKVPKLTEKVSKALVKAKIMLLGNIRQEIVPPPIISLAYASEGNFTGGCVYGKDAEPLLRPEAMALLQVAAELAATQNLRLKIFDAFRPAAAQQKLWDAFPDPNYIAPPQSGSPHTRGVAVDLTLTDANGGELDMGADFDEFAAISHHGARNLSAAQQRARLLLLGLMTTAGWDFYRNEWWHYQLFDPQKYPLMDESLF